MPHGFSFHSLLLIPVAVMFFAHLTAAADEQAAKPPSVATSQPQTAPNEVPLVSPGVIQSEFIYDQAPFPRCHASTIAWTGQSLVAG